jgi:glycerate kinase
MCDVTNPLLGERGAARVFGPQKGATPKQVELLEEGLTRLAACLKEQVGVDVTGLEGGGAAGGLGMACVAFLQGRLVSGIQEMLRISGIGCRIEQAGHVVTGEGRVDGQSLNGKVLSGVLDCARPKNIPVSVIAGSCTLTSEDVTAAGLFITLSANHRGLPLEQAMREAEMLAEDAGYRFGNMLNSAKT